MEPAIFEALPAHRLYPLAHIDLFTDGSCWDGALTGYSIGAWAVVCPQLDQWVVRGTLSGLRQSNDAAELKAVIAALEISFDCPGMVVIWSDSAYVTTGLCRLLQHHSDLPADPGDGLWHEVQSALQGRAGELRVHHVAAHRNSWQQDDPVDEWTAQWNDRADREAGAAQLRRGTGFMQLRTALLAEHHTKLHHLRLLHQLHLDISTCRLFSEPVEDEDLGDQEAALRDWWHGRLLDADGGWFNELRPNWLALLPGSNLADKFGLRFARAMIQWLVDQGAEVDAVAIKWSWLELAVYWLHYYPHLLPRSSSPGRWEDMLRGEQCPTVASAVHLCRCFFSCLGDFLECDVSHCTNLSLFYLDVFPPQKGAHLRLSQKVLSDTHTVLRAFTRFRPIRVANDLTRPLR